MANQYWEEAIETMPVESLQAMQSERLSALVRRAYDKTVLYRRKFDRVGIKPEDIRSLEDVQKLPLTNYVEDFVACSLDEKLAVPWESVAEIMTTTGTLSGFTQPCAESGKDVDQDLNLWTRNLIMAGIKHEDIVQLLLPMDSILPVLRKIVAMVIPSMAGRMILDHQIRLAKMLKSTVICAMPSYLARFVARASELGINLGDDASLRLALLFGEPLAPAMRKTVKEETGIELCDQYGFAEVMGVGGECTEREGLHIWADHYLIEVIDPESLKVLGPGEEGELVVTTLTREAVPLIRYRTGDITMILDEGACRCGRTHPRIAPIRGRVHDMIKLQGEALLPRDIEDVILTIPELCQEYRIVLDQPAEVDVLKVVVEHVPQVSDLDSLKRKAELALAEKAGVQCQVELVPQGRLQQARFKAERINRTYKVQQA